MKTILAVLIPSSPNLSRTEIELISAGKGIANDLGGSLSATILGSAADNWNAACAGYGVDTIYQAAGDPLPGYQPDLYAAALKQIYDFAQPDLVLLPSTTYGLEITPIFSYRIGASATLDCIGLKGDASTGSITITKPVYGGKANSELVAKSAPVVIAMRMRSVTPASPGADRTAEVVTVSLTVDPARARTKIVERFTDETGAAKLEDARIIVSGGRGLGGPEAFADLTVLANMLGGTVGASRAACDQGWVPASLQIGQTGKKVAPDLYLAVGISGASQHMVGIAGARHIVAINKDAKAPIFQMATCGVIDDFKSFLPQFTAALRGYQEKSKGTSHGS
jgi:electron transfer flavoprotein alpha subunit